MPKFRVSPRAFARIALVALVLNCAIVLTGAAVRITGSGLGCPTWPTCNGTMLVGAWEYHTTIEWGNRLFTVAITLWTALTVVAALLRQRRRRDLAALSASLIGGIFLQIVLGGLTVLFELRPAFVMTHFMVSTGMLALAMTLWNRARVPGPEPVAAGPRVRKVVHLDAALALLIIFLGTATTAAGPHSGGSTGQDIARLGDLETAVRMHAGAVAALLVVAIGLRVVVRDGDPRLRRLASLQIGLLFAQAAVGITQYALQLPRPLVELHVAGALAIWLVTLQLVIAVTQQRARAPAATERTVTTAAPEPSGLR